MKLTWLSIALFMIALSGCKSEVDTQPVQLAADKHRTQSYIGKPHAPVSMDYDLQGAAILDQDLSVRLDFTVQAATESLTIHYQTAEGVVSLDAHQQFDFSRLAKGAKSSVEINVRPEKTGRVFINVFARIEVNGQVQSRAFAVPLQVAATASSAGVQAIEKSQPQQAMPGKGMKYIPEQGVISMPAKE